jgi:class 3 adenylate cyclase
MSQKPASVKPWMAPSVIRKAQSLRMLYAWFDHENQFCKGPLATTLIIIGLILPFFIPLDLSFGARNPSLAEALLIRGLPSLLFMGHGLWLKFGSSALGPAGFLYHKLLVIFSVNVLLVSQHIYTYNYPDRARFYAPLIAAFAVYATRTGPFGSALFFGLQFLLWLILNQANPMLMKDLNYQIFGLILTLVFQRRISSDASGFAKDEARKKAEREVELLKQKRTMDALMRFLPQDVARDVGEGKLDLHAEPERRTVTILFCDIVGFSRLSESVPIHELARFLNAYFTRVSQIVFDHGGMIDKFLGDGVMAIFGYPKPLTHHEQVVAAIACAKDILLAFQDKDQNLQSFEEHEVKIRIGLNQGEAIVGAFGGEQRMDFTAIGSSVNFAQRIESAAGPGEIFVSESVALCSGMQDLESAGEHLLRGIGSRKLYRVQQTNGRAKTPDEGQDAVSPSAESRRSFKSR